jgi:hypothetical protein
MAEMVVIDRSAKRHRVTGTCRDFRDGNPSPMLTLIWRLLCRRPVAACATCHVYVDEEWTAGAAGSARRIELELLRRAQAGCKPNSRLSCQVTFTGMRWMASKLAGRP